MKQKTDTFNTKLYTFYEAHQREMPWRSNTDPYWVLVSEMMLQQTQVSRVIPKFTAFIDRFPTIQALAQAQLQEVLQMWIGLGYNRRAKFLHQSAQRIVEQHAGRVPQTVKGLIELPGIGSNTAGAIMVYAYNQPVVYIETNIRAVFIHEFYRDQQGVTDAQILPLIQKHMNTKNPRQWYWALMDYGFYLKKTITNPSRLSKHYARQSQFEGSQRQIRGRVIALLAEKPLSRTELIGEIDDSRLGKVLQDLTDEQMIAQKDDHYSVI